MVGKIRSHEDIYLEQGVSDIIIVGLGNSGEVLSVYRDGEVLARAFNSNNSLELLELMVRDSTGLNGCTGDVPAVLRNKAVGYALQMYGRLFIPELRSEHDYLYTEYTDVKSYVDLVATWDRLKIETRLDRRLFVTCVINTVLDNLKQQYNIQEHYVRF